MDQTWNVPNQLKEPHDQMCDATTKGRHFVRKHFPRLLALHLWGPLGFHLVGVLQTVVGTFGEVVLLLGMPP